ncbi:hypothetical protein EMCG_06040 [[Emmonsia] crescens]|uniref:Uncharacterized protein n=1 Tax=[Emmonsia] crescens TaxID=73230 RepID=A0A0G2J783_9EURO|nr:hypothetical protein EMCG_06040 [Emmonsia crescens UAMH 3008]
MDIPTIDIPETRNEWVADAGLVGVLQRSIFDFLPTELNSGSKIEKKQFLALRTIWTSKEAKEFKPAVWGIALVNEALQCLTKVPEWRTYLRAVCSRSRDPIPQVPMGLASLSIVWYYHQLVQGRAAPPDKMPRPDRKIKVKPVYPLFLLREHRSTLYPNLEDEQIVNMHLIGFLTSLEINCKITNCQWNFSRKIFKVERGVQTTCTNNQTFKPASVVEKVPLFEARTDDSL